MWLTSIRLASMLYLIDSGEAHDIPVPDEVRSHLWQVAWFPDGEKLILTAESESEGGTLWQVSIFGGSSRKLRAHVSGAVTAAVSPQGSSIAFGSEHGSEVWVMGANGEDPKRILSEEGATYSDLAWSPFGVEKPTGHGS
jgi:Tol biopolymer transport system component